MREKMAEILGWKYSWYNLKKADQILSYQREEIEKEENPYDSDIQGDNWVGWQVCHKKILALLK